MVCFKTVYRWLYTGRLVKGVLAVSQRPKEVCHRETFGHWELDTLVSDRGKSKGCVATFIERKTRLYRAIRMADRTALSIEIAFGVEASQYPVRAFRTRPLQGICLLN